MEYTKDHKLGLINKNGSEDEEDVESSQDREDGPSKNSKTIYKQEKFEIMRGKKRSNNPKYNSSDDENESNGRN